MTKLPYQAPTLRAHGKVEAITEMNSGGTRLDAPFEAGDLISDLTSS